MSASASFYPDDYDVTKAETQQKYKAATDVCNAAMAKIVAFCIPGRQIFEICQGADKEVKNLCFEVAKTRFPDEKMRKGVAFPCCVSLNECVANYSPITDPKKALKEGDLVKVEFGAHIDGCIGVIGHSFIATAKPSEVVEGKKADAICAAYFASEAALRLLRPGNTMAQVTEVINKVAEDFKCKPVEGTYSCQMQRYMYEGEKKAMNAIKDAEKESAGQKETFEKGEVYQLNVVITTGRGRAREQSDKPTVFRRDPIQTFSLRMQSSRAVFGEIKQKFPQLPFCQRSITNQKARLGMTEIIKHNLIVPYPVQYERKGQFVAQFKTTVVIGEKSIVKCTAHALPFVKSQMEVTNAEVKDVMALSLDHA
mmetsp:Transcript_8062/g.12259  ORF Transcript_8062/g.12259 Transcript_8062/m.12259 type:complete len:368 (-) Transcript_8062:118-1221(-)